MAAPTAPGMGTERSCSMCTRLKAEANQQNEPNLTSLVTKHKARVPLQDAAHYQCVM